MDYLATHGINALGSRLRRLLERLDRDVAAIYRAANICFEARWFPVFIALHDNGPLTVGALSERLGVTHAAISQGRAALGAEGLIAATRADAQRPCPRRTPQAIVGCNRARLVATSQRRRTGPDGAFGRIGSCPRSPRPEGTRRRDFQRGTRR